MREEQLRTTAAVTSGGNERNYNNYTVKLRPATRDDDDVTDDVRPRQLVLSRSDQLGFGFSAAGQRPTTIRSVIKGRPLYRSDRCSRSVGVCHCRFTRLRCADTAEWIEVLFGVENHIRNTMSHTRIRCGLRQVTISNCTTMIVL